MDRSTIRLALAGALSVCLSAGGTLLASRGGQLALPAAQDQRGAPLLVAPLPGAPPAGVTLQDIVAPGNRVTVLVELQEDPGAVAYAAALERTPSRDAQAIASAAAAGRQQLAAVAAEQARVGAALAATPVNGSELYRVQRAMNAIAVTVDNASLAALRRLPGVKAVHPLELEYPQNSTSVPFTGAPAVWDTSLGPGLNVTGTGIRVGIIDTGVDYQHPTFGGNGQLADYQANDRTAAPDSYFPTAKVVGGWDFAGDAYNGGNAPAPDADPMDCNGHGTHVAGTAAGFGVNSDGTTFAGPFGNATPFSSLRIGPGTAPQASVYALRVFGCGGGTNLTVQAIDWAMDPNGDSDLSDRLDVINMSLGSNFGGLTSGTAIAADNAARAGVIVVTSAGNSGDTYFISGSPGSASRAIATAASVDSGISGSGLRVNAPAGIAGSYVGGAPEFGPAAPAAGLNGNVIIGLDPADAAGLLTTDGCSPLTNAPDIAGNIALIDRGTCGFAVKVKNAQDAGAIGAIIANSSGGVFGGMGGADPTITIPSVMVTFDDGNTLKANIASLNVTLLGGGDTLASFSSRGPRGGQTRIVLKPDIAAPGYQILSAQTGITCTGSGASTGCQTPAGGGFLADGQPLRLNGTSMAAPHIAGIMALLRQLHPDWPVEELKALIMNRALHDVTVLPSGPTRYGLGRIGAGRVDASLAAQSSVIAFNAEEPGLVSLSFEGDVLGTATRQKKLRLVNHGTTPQTYDLAIDVVVDAPGVAFSTPGGSTVTVPANQSVELTVQMDANASQMDRARDSSVPATQAAPSSPASVGNLGALPRQWITEEAAYLTLGQSGATQLRVPLYTTPAPISNMSAGHIATGGAPTGSTTIPLSGTDVCTGTLGAGPTCTGSFATDVVSLVTPFELQVASPQNPAAAPPEADLQYVGVAHTTVGDEINFGVSTWAPWKTPNDVSFSIFIDCGNYTTGVDFNADTCTGAPDGAFDLVLFNTNPGSLSALFGVSGVVPQDTFITAVFVRARNSIVFGPVFPLNRVSGNLADTRVFDNQVAILAAPRSRLKIGGAFNYWVQTCPGNRPLCQTLSGFHYDEAAGPYTWNRTAQGVDFGGALYFDLNGATLPVTWNTANLTANGSLGALLLHHHNGEGHRAEPVLLDTSPQTDLSVNLTASTTTPTVGEPVTLTLRVQNNGPEASNNTQVQLELPPGLSYVSDDGSGAYDPALGLWTIAGALPASQSRTLQVVVSADTAAQVSARATVTSGSPLDPLPFNNVSTLGVMAPGLSDLQITAAGPAPNFVGVPVPFTVTVTNAGADTAYNVVVANTMTVGSGTIQSGTASAGLFDAATGEWRLASLAPGAQHTLTMIVLPQQAPAITLQAQAATSSQDASLANNTGTATQTLLLRATELTTSLLPGTSLVDETRTLVVTLRDTTAGLASNPAGTVALLPSHPDVTVTIPCVLTPTPLTMYESSCEVTVSGSLAGLRSIATSYDGNLVHAASLGTGTLTVETRPSTTTAANATATTAEADQSVLLTATVSSSLTVDAGIVTFTVRDETDTVIGTPAASAPITNGTATATYTLPGGTEPQTLHITAEFADGTRFGASSDATKTLTVSPEPTRIYTLTEGATGSFFETRILIANPNGADTPVTLRFTKQDGSVISVDRTLAAMSRSTVVVSEVPGLEAGAVSTTVTSNQGLPLVVERTMRWDASGYGAHTEKAEEGGSTSWYFAEGSQGFFSTFLLLANPQAPENMAHVTYFREGLAPLERSYPVAAGERRTIDLSTDLELANTSFGLRVLFDQPGFAERATYFGSNPIWTGGHASAGAKALAPSWLFAEGATGSYFSTFLLIANPNVETANVTVTYLPAGGRPVVKPYPVAGGQRLTLNIADQDPSLASGAVGSRVDADRPVVAERAQYWPQPDWIEGHSSLGMTTAGVRWGLAEGAVGGEHAEQTYILLVNPGDAPADVTVTFLRATGAPVVKPFTVAPHERRNIWVGGAGTDVPELADEAFGTLLESTQPIVVERSVYGNANGIVWATGTNATATALPLVP